MTTSAPEQVIIDALNAAHAVIYEHNSCHSSHCEKNGCMGENMCPRGQHRKLLLQIDMALAALRASSQAGERGNKAGTAQAGLVAPSSGSLPNTSGTVAPATPSAVWDMTAPGTPSEDMPAEVFEWFQHLELHLTEHDEAHAGRALRSAWPAVRDYFLTCLGAAGKPKRRADGCRHTVQRMMEWIDDGACPICAVAAAGMRRDKLHQTALVLQEVLNYGEQGLMIDEHLRNRIEQCLP